jgi:hypothetical protein
VDFTPRSQESQRGHALHPQLETALNLKRGTLGHRRDSIRRTIISLSELADLWQQMADSSLKALQGLVG